jgi:hypothetical protein
VKVAFWVDPGAYKVICGLAGSDMKRLPEIVVATTRAIPHDKDGSLRI